ncbi:MAG: hypothetical protein P4L68_10800 [Methylovirgula sp.]|nr:hypothetical protein [Methylovirgula sp.]
MKIQLPELTKAIEEFKGPRQLTRTFRVCTHRKGAAFAFTSGAFTTGWEKEARENAASRAEATDLPIYELPPTVDPARIIPKLPDAVYICHVVQETFGPVIRSDFGGMYTNRDLEKLARRAPPGLEELLV